MTANAVSGISGRRSALPEKKQLRGIPSALLFGSAIVFITTGCDPALARGLWEASRLPPDMDHSEFSLVGLTSSPFASGDEFAYLAGLLPLEDRVVVSDRPWLEGAVHVLSAENGSLQLTFGREGEGPGEYSTFPQPVRAPDCEPGEVWLYDQGLRRITKIDLERIGSDGYDRVEIRNVPVVEQPMYLAFLADSMVAMTGYFSRGRIGFWNLATDDVEFVGGFPAPGSDFPAEAVQMAYGGTLAARPDGRRFALGCESAGRIEFFSAKGVLEALGQVPFPWEPDYTVEQIRGHHISRMGFKNRAGYVDLAASQDRLWALFSGRLEFRFRGDMDQAEYVHEFDWEGRLIRAFKLDRPVERIAFDEAGNRLLATVQEPTPSVVAFPLPSAESGAGPTSTGQLPEPSP